MSYGDPTGHGYDDGDDRHDDHEAVGAYSRPASGRATVGRASVPGGGGSVGRASVGRASVAAIRSDPQAGFYDQDALSGGDIIEGGGGARPPRKPPTSAKARARKRRRRNLIIAGLAALIMIAGVAVVGGTYFFDTVEAPDAVKLAESTTILYSDGSSMAKIGDENRTLVPKEQIPLNFQHAVVAAEDQTFYTNNGVDLKGIARAAWNNFTGGQRQGGSSIAQQLGRHMADLKDISYSRKLREAVIAMKLKQQYSNEDIMWFYLNTIYFGHQAYGCEAAAQTYFGKACKDLSTEEGMVLAALIKQPEGENGSPYDPTRNPQTAKDRFEYIRQGMLKLKFLSKEQSDALKYPSNVKPLNKSDPNYGARFGLDKPTGLVLHHVMDELTHAKDATGAQLFPADKLKTGGYKIMTTIDPKVQRAAELAASGVDKSSPMNGQDPKMQAALVAVEPRTGRVKGYYGGQTDGADYAGIYSDPVLDDGQPAGFGAHRMGSSFKIYTLATGLINNISVESYWDASSPQQFPKSGRGANNPVVNAGAPSCAGGVKNCKLWEATVASSNTPFFKMTEMLTFPKVVDVAHAAGVKYIWDDKRNRINLDTTPGSKAPLGTEVGIGQYPITVVDHANGVATLAARGWAAPVHFVQAVYQGSARIFAETIKLTRIPGFTEQMADDEAWVLQKICQNNQPTDGRQTACKSGTWQYLNTEHNTDAAWIGYTAPDPTGKNGNGLAAAVWVGAKKDEAPFKLKNGSDLYGANLPGPIWKTFMNLAVKDTPKNQFPEPKFVGDTEAGSAGSPAASVNPGDTPCAIPALCSQPAKPGRSNGPGGGGGGGGGGTTTCDLDPAVCPAPTRSRE